MKTPKKEVKTEVVSETSCDQCVQYKSGWQRALADYDNLKKDLVRERGMIRASVTEGVCDSLLTLMEHFDQAIKFIPQDIPEQVTGWVQGVRHIRAELSELLRTHGIESYGVIGEPFDPNAHESVGEREEDAEPETIIEVVSLGWRQGEKILRPAKVIVCKK